MKPLSETYKELGIAFKFPIDIRDDNSNRTYYESRWGWHRFERDADGNVTYAASSNGYKEGTPRSAKTCESKVVEVDGIKYKLTAL